MAIRELNASDFTASYTRPRFGSKEAEQDWRERCKRDKERQKVISCVARGCSVETIRGTTLREFEPVTAADVGGHSNLERLKRVGAASIVTEREAKTNRGEYGWRIVEGKAVTHQGQIWEGGVSEEEFDVAAKPGYEAVDAETGRLVAREARPAIAGREVLEDLAKRYLAERVKLTGRMVAKAKQALQREAKEAGK